MRALTSLLNLSCTDTSHWCDVPSSAGLFSVERVACRVSEALVGASEVGDVVRDDDAGGRHQLQRKKGLERMGSLFQFCNLNANFFKILIVKSLFRISSYHLRWIGNDANMAIDWVYYSSCYSPILVPLSQKQFEHKKRRWKSLCHPYMLHSWEVN